MKSSKLILVVMLAVLGILFFLPARCLGSCLGAEGHFINEAILESSSTYVNFPDTGPHGDEPNLYVGDVIPADDGVCRGFLKFELPTLAPGSTVVYAQLCLYCKESEPAGRKRTIGVHSVPPAVVWDEDTATWNNPPGFANSYNPVPTDTITSEFWPGWCYWDVTVDVNQIYGMGFNTYSVAVKVEGEPDYVWNCFYCKGFEQPPPPDPNLFHPRLILVSDSGKAVIGEGSEGWTTGEGGLTAKSSMEFGGDSNLPGIKDEFFGPGSDPFDGIIPLTGQASDPNYGDADTVIGRTEGVALPPAEPCEVPIELIELNLVSTEPITVTFNGGITETYWDVNVSLDPVYPAVGQMTITKNVDTPGGIFQYHDLTFGVEFVFTDVNSGIQKTLNITTHPDFGEPMAIISHPPYEWRQTTDKQEPPCGYDGFYAHGEEPLYIELMYGIVPGHCGELYWSPPREVLPQFALISMEDWQTALSGGNIEPMGEQEGEGYLQDINDNMVDGNSYPDTNFLPPDLYVFEGNETNPNEPNDSGLVMGWGDPCALPGEPNHTKDGNDYSSGWKYNYPKDPDLSNCTLTITVYPPGGINTVSLGLQDVFGNIRVWLWDVGPGGSGKALTENVSNKVTIDLSRTGRFAASPSATSYSNTPGFDITRVAKISFDENSTFVAATQVPPPGRTDPTPWNYWTNLLVTAKTPPLPATSKYYPKWSQRPEVIDANQPNLLLGWNEFSNYHWRPIVADDWQCTDDRPVTDIHWWGSLLWWTQPYVPPVMPQAFHIAIWTDVPAGLDPNFPFSHPGYLIWENYCDNYVWSFAGYDTFPGLDPILPKESCFQFNQLLSEDEWFYQDPNAPWDMDGDPNSAVYWLSIAAIYDPTQPPPLYPWGWKTRKPSWNDDAVQIWGVEYPPVDWPAGFPPPSWPPSPGSYWTTGTPIEYPAGDSWDMAFELTTNTPDPNQPASADLNFDGIVNFLDFSIMANRWLMAGL